MRRGLIAVIAALIVIGTMVPVGASSSHPCCCKNAKSCSMHQQHDSDVCRLDRCASHSDLVAANMSACRAVLISATFTRPEQQGTSLPAIVAMLQSHASRPLHPPPRLV